ncbi:glutamyl-tRNA reductase [Pseudohongiella spirulinae]|uniref:Glutamyl-tRNA reductase n=1 Tax=Pseudohongiella spirulinae TaxID=1249552 RepID=A0A0S2KAR7_9GAMM|nr:glutamyl-tRNA reductase [Pseudohongiella spirulinae]ALO45437.1 Glutamyl-tRNA reductase [Pseudohongiella spirulinae]
MALVLLGINHNTANVSLREQVAFPPEKMEDAMRRVTSLDDVNEAVIVSTCNRTELYVDVKLDESAEDPLETDSSVLELEQQKLLKWLSDYHGVQVSDLSTCSYFHWREDVIRHLMRVACGLDSMVLGEPQILGQIKSAFAVAKELGAVKSGLGKAFQEAFSIAKEVRTDTAIGENPVSVAYAAVTLAEQIFSDLGSLNALLIGAGHTIELVARHLSERGVKQIVIANRTLQNAVKLGDKFGGRGVLLSDIPQELEHADIIVSSTNSQLPLLGKGAVERALKTRRHKPMLLVDLAVPRDIEPEVAQISDAYLYSVDDIRDVIEDGVKSRAQAAEQAAAIIERGVEEYIRQLRALNAVATLRAFRDKADRIRQAELDKARRALEKGQSPEQVLELLARGITNKLLHSPSVQMKKASAEGRDDVVTLAQELFELGDES